MSETNPDFNATLRDNLCHMNEMFDKIIRDANIPVPETPNIDPATSDDVEQLREMLVGKLSAIERCCDSAFASSQKRYDSESIKEKIEQKRRQLANLEAENAALVETAKKQQKQLRRIGNNTDKGSEAETNVNKLVGQLIAAQNEIKELKVRRKDILAENKKLSQDNGGNQEELTEEKKQQREARRQRQLEQQKKEWTQKKNELEQRLREKNKELELIRSKAKTGLKK